MKNKLIVLTILITFALMSCQIGPNVNKFNSRLLEKLKDRASFDLSCDKSKLNINQIENYKGGYVRVVGVTGCEKRATYLRENDSWIMNNAAED